VVAASDEFRTQNVRPDGLHSQPYVDFTTDSASAFPGVDFEGGVGYFLWDRDNSGPCNYSLTLGDEQLPAVARQLDEHDIFVRDTRALSILEKVRRTDELTMETIVSGDTPFGLASNFSDYTETKRNGSIAIYLTVRGRRTVAWVADGVVRKNRQLIPAWKVLLPEAYGERGAIPAMVLGPPIVVPPNSVCSQTYLVCGGFDTEAEARSAFKLYPEHGFFGFLVSLRKITPTRTTFKGVFQWVPQQDVEPSLD
jgi:site-specific DNA-methyltransferase (adenine-specific)